jgi:hypothetical protein
MRTKRSFVSAVALSLLLAACHESPVATDLDQTPPLQEGSVQVGWILTPRGEPLQIRYQVVDGMAIHEGDINLGPAEKVARTREEALGGPRPDGLRRGSVIDGGAFWSNGSVPYEISGSFTAAQRATIEAGMAHVATSAAGVSFVPRTGWWQSSYVRFELHGSNCNSAVGRSGGEQIINLTAGCAGHQGVVAHEILHALGMWHEQSRCDRDNYVTIHSENIESNMDHNFDRKCPASGWFWSVGGIDHLSYDEGSIMHYGTHAFSANGQPTISSKRGMDWAMGQLSGLSLVDAGTLNRIYQPYAVSGVSISYSGAPTISWNAYNKNETGYTVNLVVVYEEYDDYNDTSYIYDYETYPIGWTTQTSIQDSQRSYTGVERCWIYYSINGSASYAYYYEIIGAFPFGVSSQPNRTPALVASC